MEGSGFNLTVNFLAVLITEFLSNSYHHLEVRQQLSDWEVSDKIAKAFSENYKNLKEFVASEDQLQTKNVMLNTSISFKKLIGVDWRHQILFSTD